MASSVLNCVICTGQQRTNQAEYWCLECEESLCESCSEYHTDSRSSKHHDTITITEYSSLPQFVFRIEKFCTKHDEKFQVYCHDHACLCCRLCTIEDHKQCSKLSKIESIVGNVKSSSAFSDVESVLSDMTEIVERIQSDRQQNLISLEKQKMQIKECIASFRVEINEHLDKLETDIINDLCETERREQAKIESVLKSLSLKKSEIDEFLDDLNKVKKHASDMQAFHSMVELERRSKIINKLLSDMEEDGRFNIATLTYKENKSITNLTNILQFGEIVTEFSPSNENLTPKKAKQAQFPVTVLLRSIDSLSTKLNRCIDTRVSSRRGCVLLSDGSSFFTCYGKGTLSSFDKDGNEEFVKNFHPSYVFDLSYSEDKNKLFITTGTAKQGAINEMNLSDRNIETLVSDSFNYGVVVKQNTLVYCARGKGLQEWNLSDGSVRVIVSENLPDNCYITEYGDKLYYTNYTTNIVKCCGMDGRQIWQFHSSGLSKSHGVTVDNNGNVYVAGTDSTNVVVISPDGQRHIELLTEKDGLVKPQVIYYQRSKHQLLVANRDGKAFVFNVLNT